MTTPHLLTTPLAQMPALAELFRLFLSGKHLNRMAEPALWAELEKHEPSYVGLFAALGFELRLISSVALAKSCRSKHKALLLEQRCRAVHGCSDCRLSCLRL